MGRHSVIIRPAGEGVISGPAEVGFAEAALEQNDPVELGRLMIASHASLRDDFEVTNAARNDIVECALVQPGCWRSGGDRR